MINYLKRGESILERKQGTHHGPAHVDEAKEAAETKRTLEGELKRAQAPVKAKQRELQAIEREQGPMKPRELRLLKKLKKRWMRDP